MALPIFALIAANTVDGVPVVTSGDGGADADHGAAVTCNGGGCAVFSSGAGLHGFYKVIGFAANDAVQVTLDSDQGDGQGCSSTVSVIFDDGNEELFGASDETCPDPIAVAADAGGAIVFDWEGDLVPTDGVIFNPSGSGASDEGEGEGDDEGDDGEEGEGEALPGAPCVQDADCGDEHFCNASGECASSCSSTHSGGPVPWASLALFVAPVVLWRARPR